MHNSDVKGRIMLPTLRFICLLFAVCSFLFQSCENPPPTAGGSGSEGDNPLPAFTGRMVNQNNEPVAGVAVRVFSADHIPSFSGNTSKVYTTDKNGLYHIPSGAAGLYNIEGAKDKLGAFIDSVTLIKDSTNLVVQDGILKPFGSLAGITHMPGQDDTVQVRVTLFMPGTRRITKPNIGGAFTFDEMPEGSYQLIIDPTLNQYNVKVLSVSITAGQVTDLDTILLERIEPDTVDILTSSISGEWGPDKSYRIFSHVEVPAGRTLTIYPGTKILFMGNYDLTVNGSIEAVGTSDSFITFTYGLEYTGPGMGWRQIKIGVNAAKAVLKYCIIEKNYQVWIERKFSINKIQFDLSHCIISSSNIGFNLTNSATSIVETLSVYSSIFYNIGQQVAKLNIQNSSVFKIFNSIIHTTPRLVFFEFGSDATGFSSNYNSYFKVSEIQVTLGVNDITADPGFISTNSGQEDYHLSPGSPAIGTGKNGTDMGVYSAYQ